METRTNSLQQFESMQQIPLEIRTVSLGIDVSHCQNGSLHQLCEGIYQRIIGVAGRMHEVCERVSARYGIPILQRRISVTPLDRIAHGFEPQEMVHLARSLEGAAAHVRAERIGGFAADVQHGMSVTARRVIDSLPMALSGTERVRAAIHVASTEAGVNMDAIRLLGIKVKELAELSKESRGNAAARLTILANSSTGHPHLTGACLGNGWADVVLHIGVSAAAPINQALRNRLANQPNASLQDLADEVKAATFQTVRAGEVVGRDLARELHAEFGTIDATLAPSWRPGDSVAGLLPLLGVERIGAPGSAAAVSLLLNAVHAGSAFASSWTSAYARVMLSVLEDADLAAATVTKELTFDQLAFMAGAGSGGLDLIPVPGDIDPETLSAIMADQCALAIIHNRPAAIRLIPVPGRTSGDVVSYDSMSGGEAVIPIIRGQSLAKQFIQRGGRIPAP